MRKGFFHVLLNSIMLSLFRFNHPVAYLILLFLAFVVRLPSLNTDVLSQEENLLLNTVIRMDQGHTLYSETLSSVPPLLAGFWYFFYALFGNDCVMAIRMFSCIYLFLCAFFFNQLIHDFRLSRDKTLFPGVLFLSAVSFPWYAQQVTGEMLMLLPLLSSVYLLIRSFEEGVKPLSLLLMVGMLTSVSVLLEYQSVLYYFAILLIYFIMRPARLEEIVTLIIGFFLPLFFCALTLAYNNALSSWTQDSVLYRLDEFINPQLVFKPIIEEGHKIESLMALLCLLLPLIGGFLSFRIGGLGLNIRQRKIESVMAIWMVVSILMLLILGLFRHDNPVIVVIFPIVFYIWRFFMNKMNRMLHFLLFLLVFAYPIFSSIQFYYVRNVNTYSNFTELNTVNRNVFLHRLISPPTDLQSEIKLIQRLSGKTYPKVWMLGKQVGLSALKDIAPGIGFIDYFQFVNKLDFIPQNQSRSLFSSEWTLRDVYIRIEKEKPDYILDDGNIFPVLKDYLPVLLKDYSLIIQEPIPLYGLVTQEESSTKPIY